MRKGEALSQARSYAAARKERTADIDRWLTDLFRAATAQPYGRP